jgi:hypothetical protein
MKLNELRFPRRFDGVNVNQLKVQVVFVGLTGALNTVMYNSLNELEKSKHFNLRDLGGPMAGQFNNELVIRFETDAAGEILSN